MVREEKMKNNGRTIDVSAFEEVAVESCGCVSGLCMYNL